MDSPEIFKKVHFSISTFKKTKALSSLLHDEDERKDSIEQKIKRCSSYIRPKRFVPKLRPLKRSINPSFFILNDEKENQNINENSEIKSVFNDEDLSFTSISDSISVEEEKISDKITDLEDANSHDINNCKNKNDINTIKEDENLNVNKKNSKNNSISSLFNIRKKLQSIKYNSSFISIKECIDSSLNKLKKNFGLDDIYYKRFNIKKNIFNNNDCYNFNKYKSSTLFNNNKSELKDKNNNRPFLIFDVLKASQKSKL